MQVGVKYVCIHTHTPTYLQCFLVLALKAAQSVRVLCGRDRLTFTATGLLGHSGREERREGGKGERKDSLDVKEYKKH